MRILWSFSLNFFKFIWRILFFFKQLIGIFFCFLLFFFMIKSFFTYINQQKVINKYNGALFLNLEGKIVDQFFVTKSVGKIGYDLFSLSSKEIKKISLFEIVFGIRQSINDEKIKGIILKLDNLYDSDQTLLNYIGKALMEFKNSGKKVYSIGNSYTQSQYYLASFADKIYMSPHGNIDIQGFSSNKFYYKEFLDKMRVKRHIFRVGIYKSAIEPLIRSNMSLEARKIDKRLLDFLWSNYLFVVSKNRNLISKDIFPGVKEIIKNMQKVNGDYAKYAKNQKLVDELLNSVELEQKLINFFGYNRKSKSFNFINIFDYTRNILRKKSSTKNKNYFSKFGNIAVIPIQGVLFDNKKDSNNFKKFKKIIEDIRIAKNNPNIKAVILRINTPGGSVSSAEIIRDELISLRNSGKSIVASMAGVAASAGYWISTAANYIIADPITITGSIGIFGLINTFEDSLKFIGINTDGVSTTPLADSSVVHGINQSVLKIMKMNIQNGYDKFIKYVSQSRNKNLIEINKLGKGKIWVGKDAFKKGLIDKLGDFDDAVDKAAKLANIKNPNINWIQPKYSIIDCLLLSFFSSIKFIFLKNLIIPFDKKYIKDFSKEVQFFSNEDIKKNQYALCLNCFNFK